MADDPKLNVKVVIFDWSGTISNDILPCYNAGMKVRREFGLPHMELEEWKRNLAPTAVDFFKREGVKEDPYKVFKMFSDFFAEGPNRPKLFDDVKEVLSFLKSKGKTMSVVSGHPDMHLKDEAKEFGVSEFMSSVFGSVQDKAKKLVEIAKQLNLKPSEIAYVGDTTHDIHAAKRAGMHAIAITRGYQGEDQLRKDEPDFVIDSLSELKDIVV